MVIEPFMEMKIPPLSPIFWDIKLLPFCEGANPTPYIAPGPSEARLAVGNEILGVNVWNVLNYEYISVVVLYVLHLSLSFLCWHFLPTTDKMQQLLDS